MVSNTVLLPGFAAEIDHVGNILIHAPKDDVEIAALPDNHEIDTVSVDIIENALKNARNEMDTLITRASMSPAIREQQDEFNVIAEPSGKMIVGQFGSFYRPVPRGLDGNHRGGRQYMIHPPPSVYR